LIFSLKEDRDSQSRFEISAMSYKFQQFSGVIDTAEIVSAVSLTPRNRFSGVNDTVEIAHLIIRAISAVSLTPLKFGIPMKFFISLSW
jgi:hypothetical protein